MMNGLAYSIAVLAVLTSCRQAALLARSSDLPASLATLIAGATHVYLAMLIPGIFGQLGPWPIALCAALLGALTWRLLRTTTSKSLSANPDQIPSAKLDGAAEKSVPWPLLVGAGALSMPLLEVVRNAPQRLFGTDRLLAFDTVSYHLPAIIEFLQQGSLWSMAGPYQSYSFAYDLLSGFSAAFFPSTWWWEPTHLIALVWLVIALHQLCLLLHEHSSSAYSALVLTVGVSCLMFAEPYRDVGKNDVFCAATLLSATVLLLGRGNRRWREVLAAMAFGLALGSKPNMLGYLPALLMLVALSSNPGGSSKALRVGRFLTIVTALGGFFLGRNLILFGNLTDPHLAFSWDRTLWHGLASGQSFPPDPAITILLASCLTCLLAISWLAITGPSRRQQVVAQLLIVLVSGLCTYLITPFGTWLEPTGNRVWSLRLAMPPLLLATALLAVAAVSLWTRYISTAVIKERLAWAAATLVVLVIAPQLAEDNAEPGTFGWQAPKGLPATGFYDWLTIQAPMRLYSAGLRPAGLYGEHWANQVFYDLHSVVLEPEEQGRNRLANVMQAFQPQLLAIAVDPHASTGPPRKPLVEWLRRQACLEEAYSDWVVSAFWVRDGCPALTARYADPDVMPRMAS